MSCGCGSTYSPVVHTGVEAGSNIEGQASWLDSLTGSQPDSDGIAGRSPYGSVPTFGGISFCKKCFLTWAGIFFILALIFFRRS